MSEIEWYLSFSGYFISLSIMFSMLIHTVAKDKFSSLLRLSSIPLYKGTIAGLLSNLGDCK